MKNLYYLIVLTVILGLVLTGCFLSNVGQVPANEQSGISYLTKSPGPDLVGLWHFDGDAGDSSGNDNHGIVTGATYISDQWGDQALEFVGANDYVSVDDADILDITDELTIEAWIVADVLNTYKSIVVKGDANAEGIINYGLQIQAESADGTLRFFVYYGGNYEWVDSTSQVPADGQWHHVAVTVNTADDLVKFYIDGLSAGTSTFTANLPVSTSTLEIGRHRHETSGACQYFEGIIDEVRIWDTATPSFNLNVDPKLDFNPVGTDHIVTATVTIDKVVSGTEPAPGVLVEFDVSGANIFVIDDYTDSEGVATFTYTGDGGDGIDTIMATLNYPFYKATPVFVEKYWLENFVTGGGKINMSTFNQNGGGKKAAFTFGGTVGVLATEGIVGQFQIVDHTAKGAVSWHCNNDFSFLNFEGDSAESPEASHDTAIFEGDFTSNRGGMETLLLKIIDNGEPGAGVDIFSTYDGVWYEWTIDGGNFQVHNIE